MNAPIRLASSRLQLDPPAPPRLRITGELAALPVEAVTLERVHAGQTWQVLRAPEEMLADRAELERLERAIVATRKQAFAARNETTALRARLEQAISERYEPPVVWGLGILSAVALLGWLHQRRETVAAREKLAQEAPPTMVGTPTTLQSTGDSQFPGTELSFHGNEADEWIAPSRAALPQ